MIAIPIKSEEENSNLSEEFGKAKFFALINNNKIEILKNEQEDPEATANWLKDKNVNILISSHVKEKTFYSLKDNGIKVYFSEKNKIKIDEVLLKYADGELPILNKLSFLCHVV
jgi:predicted Fe-Mo cluster-binding NifX family protein